MKSITIVVLGSLCLYLGSRIKRLRAELARSLRPPEVARDAAGKRIRERL